MYKQAFCRLDGFRVQMSVLGVFDVEREVVGALHLSQVTSYTTATYQYLVFGATDEESEKYDKRKSGYTYCTNHISNLAA